MTRTQATVLLLLAGAVPTCLPASAQTAQGGGQAPAAQAPRGQAGAGAGAGAVQLDQAKMEAYLGSPAYVGLLQGAMLEAEKSQTTACNNAAAKKRIGPAIMAPIVFEGAQPTQGAWWDRLEADRCGKPATYNILVTHRPGEGSRAAPLLMGTTKADPILQRDAKSVAIDTAAGAPGKTKCKEFKIENTEFQGNEKAGQATPGAGAWLELWSLRGCGRQVPVQLRFQPTPQGTGIAARLPTGANKG